MILPNLNNSDCNHFDGIDEIRNKSNKSKISNFKAALNNTIQINNISPGPHAKLASMAATETPKQRRLELSPADIYFRASEHLYAGTGKSGGVNQGSRPNLNHSTYGRGKINRSPLSS